jgi:hypothetical protein
MANLPETFKIASRQALSYDLLNFLRKSTAEDVAGVDNAMARQLAGNVSSSPYQVVEGGRRLRLSGEDVVERAVASLERFQLIGFTESLDEAYRALASDWAFRPVTSLPRCNSRTEDLPHLLKPVREEPITPAIEAELDRLTVLDRQVMAHARAIQNRRLFGHKRAA